MRNIWDYIFEQKITKNRKTKITKKHKITKNDEKPKWVNFQKNFVTFVLKIKVNRNGGIFKPIGLSVFKLLFLVLFCRKHPVYKSITWKSNFRVMVWICFNKKNTIYLCTTHIAECQFFDTFDNVSKLLDCQEGCHQSVFSITAFTCTREQGVDHFLLTTKYKNKIYVKYEIYKNREWPGFIISTWRHERDYLNKFTVCFDSNWSFIVYLLVIKIAQ